MITVAMSAVIKAQRHRVWCALTEPAQIARWSPLALEAPNAPADYPRPGEPAHWRCRVGRMPLRFSDEPREVVEDELLRSRQRVGPLRIEEVFRLDDEPGDPGATRLHLKLVAPSSVPLLGGLMDRFAVRRFVTDLASDALHGICSVCEG